MSLQQGESRLMVAASDFGSWTVHANGLGAIVNQGGGLKFTRPSFDPRYYCGSGARERQGRVGFENGFMVCGFFTA
jgi:hypothetical protein